jgi:hypothetical protein
MIPGLAPSLPPVAEAPPVASCRAGALERESRIAAHLEIRWAAVLRSARFVRRSSDGPSVGDGRTCPAARPSCCSSRSRRSARGLRRTDRSPGEFVAGTRCRRHRRDRVRHDHRRGVDMFKQVDLDSDAALITATAALTAGLLPIMVPGCTRASRPTCGCCSAAGDHVRRRRCPGAVLFTVRRAAHQHDCSPS